MDSKPSREYFVKIQMIDDRAWLTMFVDKTEYLLGYSVWIIVLPIWAIAHAIANIVAIVRNQPRTKRTQNIHYKILIGQIEGKEKTILYEENVPEKISLWGISQVEYRLKKAIEGGHIEDILTQLNEQNSKLL